ncbi:MAG: vWA domain-containing protein [Dehalococcoidia bacterium]
MIGKIISIRVINTQGSDELSMISGRTESTTPGSINYQFENGKGMVYLVVDCSGSMDGHKIGQVKRGILDFAQDAIEKDYLVGLIKFDSSATHLCEPKSDMGNLGEYLDKINANGSTNMAAGITMAHQHLDDSKYTRVMVIATDGRPDKTQSALQAGQTAKNEGIDIITIGTDDADLPFLKKLATSEELANKVSNHQFGKAIASAYLLLPDPRKKLQSNFTLSRPEPARSLQYSW